MFSRKDLKKNTFYQFDTICSTVITYNVNKTSNVDSLKIQNEN